MFARPDLYMSHNILEALDEKVRTYRSRTALQIKGEQGWESMTYGQLWENDLFLSAYLQDRFPEARAVAILSESRPEWVVSFFGTLRAGRVCVPLDTQLTASELATHIEHSEADVILMSHQQKPLCEQIQRLCRNTPQLINIQTLLQNDRPFVPPPKPINIELDTPALTIYTSGTTGNTKAVMLSYRNLFFQTNAMAEAANATIHDRFLSILPLNHMLELANGLLGPLNVGASVTYVPSLLPHVVIETMREQKITALLGVPLFLRAMKRSIELKIQKQSPTKRWLIKQAWKFAQKTQNMETRRQLFAPIHKELGGHLRVFFVGGAALEPEVAHFFETIGIHTVQGYGLTETSPVIATNSIGANRIGSVGRALAGVEVKIEKEQPEDAIGEILARGANIMLGYFKNPELTRQVFTADRFFRTGDLGYLDQDGYLYITGRKKNLIVLGGGKKVHPEEVEQQLSGIEGVEELCVLGMPSRLGGSDEVWCVARPALSLVGSDLHSLEAVAQEIRRRIENAAQKVAAFKRPIRIIVQEEELPKSTTRKVRLNILREKLLQDYLTPYKENML